MLAAIQGDPRPAQGGPRHAETLEREAAAFTMKLSASGHGSYNARSGEHDDLLLAVALPVWHAGRPVKSRRLVTF
jgi:hypothetical protein